MPSKRSSSTTSQPAKSEPSKPARPAKTAKAAASAGKDKAAASKTRAKPKPVAKLVPEYPSGNPRRSTRQGQKRTSSVEDAPPSKKAKPPPDQGDNRTGSVIDSLGAYNEAVGENPGGASEALGGLSVSDDIPDDLLNQAMDDHEAKQTKGQAEVAVTQPYFSPSELAESKWPDVWRKKVLLCNPESEEDIWPDINERCVMCGGKFVADVCCPFHDRGQCQERLDRGEDLAGILHPSRRDELEAMMADNGGFCSNLTSARDIFHPFRRDELKIKVHSVDDMIARALEEAKKHKPDFWAIYKPTRRDVQEFTAATHEFARAYGSALDNHLLDSTTQAKDGHEAKPDKTVPSYSWDTRTPREPGSWKRDMAQLRKCMVAKHAEEEAKFQREQEEFAAAFTRSANTKAAAHAAGGSTEATKVDAADTRPALTMALCLDWLLQLATRFRRLAQWRLPVRLALF